MQYFIPDIAMLKNSNSTLFDQETPILQAINKTMAFKIEKYCDLQFKISEFFTEDKWKNRFLSQSDPTLQRWSSRAHPPFQLKLNTYFQSSKAFPCSYFLERIK